VIILRGYRERNEQMSRDNRRCEDSEYIYTYKAGGGEEERSKERMVKLSQ